MGTRLAACVGVVCVCDARSDLWLHVRAWAFSACSEAREHAGGAPLRWCAHQGECHSLARSITYTSTEVCILSPMRRAPWGTRRQTAAAALRLLRRLPVHAAVPAAAHGARTVSACVHTVESAHNGRRRRLSGDRRELESMCHAWRVQERMLCVAMRSMRLRLMGIPKIAAGRVLVRGKARLAVRPHRRTGGRGGVGGRGGGGGGEGPPVEGGIDGLHQRPHHLTDVDLLRCAWPGCHVALKPASRGGGRPAPRAP